MNPQEPLPGPVDLVERASDLAALAGRLARAGRVALDVEANSLYAYRERVCVLQATAEDRTAIVDTVALPDLSPLAAALSRPDVEVVFHGGDYDISLLTRDHAFAFGRVFDTMIAATLLGEERVGLAALVEAEFGATLDKRFQTVDWARRPLTGEQIAYLCRDTAYLLPLRDRLGARLLAKDLGEEAEIEFRRLAERRGRPAGPAADGWRRADGAARLDARGRAVAAAVHRWREEEARRRDVPPFKVLSPRALTALGLAADDPGRLLADLPGLSPGERRRVGREVRLAVREGLDDAGAGRTPPADPRPPPTDAERRRRTEDRRLEDALKDWRREEARARGVPPVVVLPNPALEWILRTRPTTVAALLPCADVGAKRAARYGEAILEAMRRAAR